MSRDYAHTAEADLLAEFAGKKSEAAFTELVRRHLPMVFGVCRRVLGDDHSAQDAAQAVFLTLARKADSLRREQALGGWLHHVALCAARKERTARERRLRREQEAATMNPTATDELTPETTAALRESLDRELDALPAKYRLPLVMVHLEGRSMEETAAALKCKDGTLRSWLSRACEKLRARLAKRGTSVSVTAIVAWLASQAGTASAAVPSGLAAATAKSAVLWVTGGTAAAGIAPNIILATQATLEAMFISKLKTAALVTGTVACIATVGIVIAQQRSAQRGNVTSARTAEARPVPRLITSAPPESVADQAPATTPQPQSAPTEPKAITVSQPAPKEPERITVSPYVCGGLYQVIFRCPAPREERMATPTKSCIECHTLAKEDWPKIVEGKPQDLSSLRRTRWGVRNRTSGGQKAPLYVKVGQEFEIELPVSSGQIGSRWFQGPAPVEIFKEIKDYGAETREKNGVPIPPLSGDASSAEIIGESVVTVGDTMNFVPHPRVPEEPAVGSYFLRYRAVKAGPSEIRLHSFRQRDQETQYVAEYILPVQVEGGTETVAAAFNEGAARELAKRWVTEVLSGRVERVMSLSDVPFCLDRKAKLKSIEELQRGLKAVIGQFEAEEVRGKGVSLVVVGTAVVLKDNERARVVEGWRHLMVTDGLVFVAVNLEIDRVKADGVIVALKPGNPLKVVGFAD